MKLYEIRTYRNDEGMVIQEHARRDRPIEDAEPAALYTSSGTLHFTLPTGQQGQAQFSFEIPGASIGEAFENYPAASEAGRRKAEEDLRRQIAAQQRPGLVLPNGLPLPPPKHHPARRIA